MSKTWITVCWIFIGTFALGFPGGILMYFTEPDATFFESIGVAFICLFLAYVFYIVGPRKNSMKRKEEMISIAKEEERKDKIKKKETKLIQEMLEMMSNASDYKLIKDKLGAIDYLKNSEDYKNIKNFVVNSEAQEKESLKKAKWEKAEAREQKRLQKRAELEKELHELCINENEWESFKNSKICIGMHMSLVQDIKGEKYDEKSKVTADKTTLKYKYGRFENQRGNWSYELEVTFENDRVTSFRDL